MSESDTDLELQDILATFWRKSELAEAQGRVEEARAWMEGIVELDEHNVEAWLALARLVPSARERMQCYSTVLQIAPGNEQAKTGLRKTRRQL